MTCRDGVCVCLAIYDWEGEITSSRFHEIAKAIFSSNGVDPNVISYSDAESANKRIVGYPITEEVLWMTENRKEFGLGYYHMLDNWKTLMLDWDIMAYLNTGMRTITICYSEVINGNEVYIIECTIKKLAALVQLRYGIAYRRSFRLGPGSYADGMVSGLGYSKSDMEEGDRIGAWFNERIGPERHLKGMLRDVYPLNILSLPHLERKVGKLSLARWISESPSRGQLEPLPRDSWIWRVPEEDLQVVRDSLIEAELLIAYSPYRG